jgi:putative FmdB family regulatory protein
MPTYEYECCGCGRRFEVVQKITDDPLVSCEECGGELRRVIFAAGIVFKGPGFHVTDYCNNSKGGGKSCETCSGNSEPKVGVGDES